LGDGLMALFGYPVAQENDTERAVRAALAIQRSLADLNRKNAGSGKPALAARIAVDSGPVVVDTTGEIFGDVPNIAARAQALAEPGAVVVTGRGSLIVVLDRAQGGRSRPLRWWRTLTPQSLRPVLLAARRVTYRINAKFGFSALRCYFANPLPKLG
jgi:class 3 adenylate cyclase